MKKITVILLAATMLFTSVAMSSCAENNADAITTETEETAAESETESVIEERLPDPVPNLDLGNTTVTFIVRGSSYAEWESQDIFEEEDSDDPIKSAVFRRNMTLQDKYHCTIEQYGSSSPGADAKKAINANTDEYQVLMCDTQ